MSSILKALRKLEEEKVVRGERPLDLAVDIHRGVPQRRRRPFRWAALALVVAGTSAGAVWMLYPPATQRFPAAPVLPPQSSPPTFAPKAVNPPQPVVPPSLPAADTAVPPTGNANQGRKMHGPVAKAQASRSHPSRTVAPGPTPTPPAVEESPPMRLTGIAWQQDPASRMAIINDLPVMVGTVIAGAKVLEIHSDRVVLSVEGKKTVLVLRP